MLKTFTNLSLGLGLRRHASIESHYGLFKAHVVAFNEVTLNDTTGENVNDCS